MGCRSIPRTIAYSLPLLLLLILAVSAQSGVEAERGDSRGSKDLGRRSKIKLGILEVNTLGVKTEGDSVAIGLHVDSGLGIFDAFIASLSMILVSEIGDETFIIAALMAMRHPRSIVLSGALSALFIMTILSTGLGRIVPNLISRKHTNSAATVLYLFFGLRLLYIAWRSSDSKSSQKKEIEEVEEKLESGQGKTPFRRFFSRFLTPIFLESFILTFLAEWGDRSQIATIALATHKNAVGVAVGATLGHTICTSVAVVGGIGDFPNESLPVTPVTLHAKSVKNGTLDSLDVRNYVTSLYVKSSNLAYAHKLFDESPDRDVRSWTILISGFARVGSCKMVLELFKEMQFDRVCPNQFTLSSVLKSCSSLSDFRTGKGIHGWILRHGIDLDMVLENSILDVYVKCGGFDYAERLFEAMEERDTVTWNIMMGAYMHVGDMEKALDLFRRLPFKDVASWNTILYGLMQNGHERYALELLYEMVENGPPFNRVTFSEALVLASSLSVLELGRQIHGCLLRLGIPNDGFLQTSLIDMYCKCGKMEKATLVFKTMHLRANSKFTCHEMKTEIVSWSSMVSGYVHNGEYEYALLTFCSLVRERILVDRFSVTSVVSACANVGILLLGQHIHAHIQKIGYKIDVHLGSSYIDIHETPTAGGRCGIRTLAGEETSPMRTGKLIICKFEFAAFQFRYLSLMERFVLLPFAIGCISESSVAVGGVQRQSPRRSKPDTNRSPIRTKEAEEEEDEEDRLSGESMKNSFRSLALPKPNISTGVHRLFKGFKNFSQLFVYKDDMEEEVLEMGMEIGCPTDVKHVTHIGWDASASAASATIDPVRGWDNLVSPDLLSVSPLSWRQFELSVPSQAEAAVPPLVHGSSS
ncbi:unnamed protein product [Malus baccata var. baccata]